MSALADMERKLIAALEEIKRLTAEVASLRQAVTTLNAGPVVPIELRLTKCETGMLEALMAPGATTKSKEQLLAAAYSDRYATGDEPEIKIVDVFICKLRKKLKPFGIEVETVWGQGYHLPPESRAILRRMTDGAVDKIIRCSAA